MKKNELTSKKTMFGRMSFVLIAIVLVFAVSIGGVVYWAVFRGSEMSAWAENQQLSTLTVDAARGNIYDCKGNLLAESGTVYDVYISPNKITNASSKKTDKNYTVTPENISKDLSKLLGLKYEDVYKLTEKKTEFEYVKKKVEKDEANNVREYITKNALTAYIGLNQSTKRYYPEGSLCSTVLGFVGTDNQGLSGIEVHYDTVLKGVPGKIVIPANAKGENMPFAYETMINSEQGKSLTLTIDKNVQYIVEKYLNEAVITNKASNKGCCIVMNVNTGEIVAMATKPDFDPNEPFTITDSNKAKELESLKGEEFDKKNKLYLEEQWRNKAIADTYEPGSVFKIITGSAAIEENKVNSQSTFDCPGYIVISGQKYNCTGTHGHQNLTNIFENSCNPAFIEIGQRLGSTLFYKYFRSFGFTKLTGIDLPGEAEGIYYTEKNMGPVELASESFGQTFRITPIQLITAVSAACNGGHYMQPHIVKEITDKDGNVVEKKEPHEQRQVISESTSKMLCSMLRSVVDNGTGRNAYVAGYRMCGKTGTSQKIDSADSDGNVSKYIASFCGFAPADNPQYAILVMIDEPNGDSYYGGSIAAPVAKSIMSEILPILGVEAMYSDAEAKDLNITVPGVVGKSVSEAQSVIEQSGFGVKVVGSGDVVQKQVPSSGVQSPKNCTVVLYTDSSGEQVSVPDFINLTLSEAESLADEYGLNISSSGMAEITSDAIVYKQNISAGQKVEKGTIITVYFKANDSVD